MAGKRIVSGASGARKAKGEKVLAVSPPFEWEGFRRPTIGKLDTITRVRRELARLYRQARYGEVSATDAASYAKVLYHVARLLELERGPRELPQIIVTLEDPGEVYQEPERADPA